MNNSITEWLHLNQRPFLRNLSPFPDIEVITFERANAVIALAVAALRFFRLNITNRGKASNPNLKSKKLSDKTIPDSTRFPLLPR